MKTQVQTQVQPQTQFNQILRLPEVMNMVKLGRASIYSFVKAGTFPAPIRIGARASGWILAEIQQWIDRRIEQRGGR